MLLIKWKKEKIFDNHFHSFPFFMMMMMMTMTRYRLCWENELIQIRSGGVRGEFVLLFFYNQNGMK